MAWSAETLALWSETHSISFKTKFLNIQLVECQNVFQHGLNLLRSPAVGQGILCCQIVSWTLALSVMSLWTHASGSTSATNVFASCSEHWVSYWQVLLIKIRSILRLTYETTHILSLIRRINPSKASGPDGISGQMLLICDDSIVIPKKIIFENILSTSIYPNFQKRKQTTS